MKFKHLVWIIVVLIALGVIFYPMVSGNESIQHKTVLEEIRLPALPTPGESPVIKPSTTVPVQPAAATPSKQ